MAATSDEVKKLTFRRFRDNDHEPLPWQEEIMDADHSHKCPEYVLSTPPCSAACPSGEDIRGYLSILRGVEKPVAGMPVPEYAFRRLTEANPFPAVMGRVCPAPCETGCNRNTVDDHVGINSVEQFLGDYAIRNNLDYATPAQSSGRKVAIIGGGPAGLSCAYQLRLRGHECTIFEEHGQLGGMMRYGIPGFRTPREVLDAEIRRILDLGVETRLNTRVGRDITLQQLEDEFDAVFMAMGAQSGRPLAVKGAEAPNCVTGIAFLRAFNDGRLRHVGNRVVVIGGGDTSIDVATVAKRLGRIKHPKPTDRPELIIQGTIAHDVAKISAQDGAEVILVSRATQEKMNANKHEIEEALAEGIEIRGGLVPVEVVLSADGRATALRVAKLEMVNGKQVAQAGSEYDIEADLIVAAIGQAVDFTGLEEFNNGKGLINADKNYQVAGKTGYFVGGDVVRPHLLTTAIGHGWIAAEGIDRYLRNEELGKRPKVDVHYFNLRRKMEEKGIKLEEAPATNIWGTDRSNVAIHNFDNRSDRYVIHSDELFLGHFPYVQRNKRKVTTLGADAVVGHFEERMEGLTEQQAIAEAKRCMSCGLCFECDNCVVYCPQTAVYKVPKSQSTTGRYVDTDYDKCIGCHVCADVCPTGYIRMGMGD